MRHDLQSLQHEAKHQASADLRQLQAIEDLAKRFAAGRGAHDTRQGLRHALSDEQFARSPSQLIFLDFCLLRVVAVPGLRFLFGGESVLSELVDVAGDTGVGEVVIEG